MDIAYINQDIEQRVLSQIINNNNLAYKVSGLLNVDYFGVGLHKDIFIKLMDLVSSGSKVDYFILSKHFDDKQYIKELQLIDCSAVLFNDYCLLLKDLWIKRYLTNITNEIGSRLMENEDSEGLLSDIQNRLINLDGDDFDNIKTIGSYSDIVMDKMVKFLKTGIDDSKITTGFYDIDKLIGGYGKGELIIIAARPSMGKTSFGLQSAIEISKNKPVYFMSLEMSISELNKKSIGLISENSLYNEYKINENIQASRELNNYKLFINDRSRHNINSICNSIRIMKHKHNICCAFIDYIGLIDGSGAYKNNKVYEIQEITKGLKEISKELDIPVICLAQLNRAVDNRNNKTPTLSDLRDSGSIEQDADIVMMLHREEYYLEKVIIDTDDKDFQKLQDKLDASRGKADIIIQKNRNGRTGNVRMRFIKDYTKFMCLEG